MRRLLLPALAALLVLPHAALADSLRLGVAGAEAGFDPNTNQPVLNVMLTEASARAFGRFTAKRVGLAVDLRVDGKVMSSPRIHEPILGGALQVSGLESAAAAQELAVAVREGKAAVVVADPK